MKFLLFLLSLMSVYAVGVGQPSSYDAGSIPADLKKNASVIKRYENIVLTVNKVDDVIVDCHQVYTVLNEDGKGFLQFSEYTNKHRTLDEAEIKVYDAAGKQIAKHKKKEMRTQAVGEGLIEDGYVTFYDVNTSTYPITVEFKYQVKMSGTLRIPDYRISHHEEGVEQSYFTARVPDEIGLRFRQKNLDIKPEITKDGKYSVYKWAVKGLAPYEYEEGAVSDDERYPSVKMALNRFSLYGYDGDMSSWKNFGQWINSLYKDLDVLPQEKIHFFKDLVKNSETDREKAMAIYDYLQRNFRYVSIQLGIGGFKPFSATFTDQKKYGDCKALSNYMRAALKVVGVNSHLAIINAGYNDEPVNPDFPSNNSFNHVILCIPQNKDSIWLECTSSTSDFNQLGTGTENRHALLITEEGGVLVSTPRSQASSNKLLTTTIVQLNDDGSGTSQTTFRGFGSFNEILDGILKAKRDDQKEFFVFGFSYKQPDDFEFSKKHDELHASLLKMSIEKIPEFTAGSKMFLSPRIYKIWPRKLPPAENRRLDFYFKQPFVETDTTIYKLPEGYKPDALPPPKSFFCEYARFTTNYWFDEQQRSVGTAVTIELKEHKIPAKKYAEIKKFFDDIMLNDGQRIVIKKE